MTAKISITERQFDWLMRLLLVLFIGVVFWPAIFGNFVSWDDGPNLTDNPHLSFTWQNIVWMFTDCQYVPRYLPLGWFSYALERAFFGNSALLCHIANLVVHILNAILLYEVLKKILAIWINVKRETRETREKSTTFWQHGGAAVGALWWGVNPMRTETVAWASGFIYAVAGLFFFLAVWIYLRQKTAQAIAGNDCTSPIPNNNGMNLLAAGCFGISLLTYPIALGGLAVFVILDVVIGRLPVQVKDWWRPTYWKVWLQKLYFVAPAFFMFLVTWLTVTKRSALGQSHLGLPTHALQAFWVWAWYVWKPWLPFDLSPKYPDLLGESFYTPQHLAAAFLVILITILAVLWRRRWPSLLTIWLAYLALTAPFIGPTQHPHYTNDRYCYIMGGVWSVAIAMGFLLLMRRPQLRLALPLAAVLACGFFGWQSRVQTFFWNNSLNLHSWMAEKINGHPEAAMHEMGSARMFLVINHTNDALTAMRRAVSVNPKDADSWAFFGDILAQQGRLEPAISTYQKALTLIPEMDTTRQKLAGTFAKAGLHEQAVKEYSQLIQNYPELITLRTNVAISLEKLGRKAEAQEQLKKAEALESKPGNASEPAPGKQS